MADDQASRCAQGLGMYEQQYCGDTRSQRIESARYALQSFEGQCTDGASVARMKQIRQACFPKYFAGEAARVDDRRAIRQRYLSQVSELLLDPAYGPAVDRYKDLEEQRFQRRGDPRFQSELAAARAVLVELCAKHGVDARYNKELALW